MEDGLVVFCERLMEKKSRFKKYLKTKQKIRNAEGVTASTRRHVYVVS